MPTEAIYLPERRTVRFAIYPGGHEGPRILAEITGQALTECYEAQDSAQELIKAYQTHFAAIQTMALSMYAQSPATPVELNQDQVELRRKNPRSNLIG